MHNVMDKVELIKVLCDSRERLVAYLSKIVNTEKVNYRTFGTDVEDYILEEVVNILREAGVKGKIERAETKNDFPDLTVFITPKLALELKAGSRYRFSRKMKKWGKCINSNNDLGTLSSWPKHLDEFGGENIYFIFIEYDFHEEPKKILDIRIGPFYELIGKNKAGFLSYREGDGKLRPRNFDAGQQIHSTDEFKDLLPKTAVYRSKRVVRKHQKIIEDNLKLIPEKEREEFIAYLEGRQMILSFDDSTKQPGG